MQKAISCGKNAGACRSSRGATPDGVHGSRQTFERGTGWVHDFLRAQPFAVTAEHAAFTLAVQVLFDVFFGILGLVLATPVAAVLVLIVRRLYVEDALGDRPPPGAVQAPS